MESATKRLNRWNDDPILDKDGKPRIADIQDSDQIIFALFNRFKWEDADARGRNLRVRSGLHFDDVLSVKAHKLKRGSPLAVVSLLDIRFTPAVQEDGPASVELLFAGGGMLRLEVECLNANLSDVSGPWAARARPTHGPDEA